MDAYWTMFRETGDPLCYLIARRLEAGAADAPASPAETARPAAQSAVPAHVKETF